MRPGKSRSIEMQNLSSQHTKNVRQCDAEKTTRNFYNKNTRVLIPVLVPTDKKITLIDINCFCLCYFTAHLNLQLNLRGTL